MSCLFSLTDWRQGKQSFLRIVPRLYPSPPLVCVVYVEVLSVPLVYYVSPGLELNLNMEQK